MTKRNIKVSAKSAKSTAPAKAAPVKKATNKAAGLPPVQPIAGTRAAFVPDSASNYAGLKGTALGAFTLASLIVSGLAKLAPKASEMTAGDDASIALFRAMVGPTAYRHHLDKYRTGRLTADGLAFFNARLVGKAPTYNTDPETVRAMVQAATKGGVVHIGEQEVSFTKKLAVTSA
jgi:hypothetical protein